MLISVISSFAMRSSCCAGSVTARQQQDDHPLATAPATERGCGAYHNAGAGGSGKSTAGRAGCSGAERRYSGSEGISTEQLQEVAKLLQRELL